MYKLIITEKNSVAAETLKAAQSLYEKKLITYPRTSSNYLSEDMRDVVVSTVKCLANYNENRVANLLNNSLNIDGRIINNDKIQDHHSIIPTTVIGKLSDTNLSDNESKIITLIINRFLSALDKPYIYDETKFEFQIGGYIFKLTVKNPVQMGFRRGQLGIRNEELGIGKNKTVPNFPTYEKFDTFTVTDIAIKPCETSPPKHYTDSTLLRAMEHAKADIPSEDREEKIPNSSLLTPNSQALGTPATRAAIIEELIAAGYVRRNKKQLISTDYGRAFIATIPDIVKSVELTANWEMALSDIENGTGNAETLLANIKKSIADTIAFELAKPDRQAVSRKKEIGICPRCKSQISESAKAFYCTAGKENCGFFIWKSDKRIGRNYTAAEISELLSTGKVALKNCKSSKGNTYNAVFEIEDSGQYVNLKFARFVNLK